VSALLTPPVPVETSPAARGRLGGWSLVLALVALVGAALVAGFVGATIVPMEAAHGTHFADTPPTYRTTVTVLGATMLLWTAAGIAALATGLAAVLRGERSARAVWGIALALAAPVVTILVLVVAMLVSAAAL
jgi:vacuolar-type H+-ATPase subunit I/STV1